MTPLEELANRPFYPDDWGGGAIWITPEERDDLVRGVEALQRISDTWLIADEATPDDFRKVAREALAPFVSEEKP